VHRGRMRGLSESSRYYCREPQLQLIASDTERSNSSFIEIDSILGSENVRDLQLTLALGDKRREEMG